MKALLLALCLALGADAADPEAAARAYREGRYEEAHALFAEALRAPDAARGALLYNLGNCAFRLGRHAEAVLCYRRALRALPGDADVVFNLHRAERALGIAPAADPSGPLALVAALRTRLASLTPATWLLLIAALETLGAAALLRRSRRARAFRAGGAVLVLAGLALAAHAVHARLRPPPRTAVVLAPRIALRADPHPSLPPLLELPAGTTLEIAEASDHWMRVLHPRGEGWAERRGIALVE